MINTAKNFTKNRRVGFTLIELMVSISIFTLLLGASIGSILGMVDANRKAQSLKSVLNNLNIAVDTISRDVVVSRNFNVNESEEVGDCPSVIEEDGTKLEFEKEGESVGYRLNMIDGENECDGFLEKKVGDEGWTRITAPEVRVKNLRFVLNEDVQPRVLILVEGQAGYKDNIISDFRVQTTASQRSPESNI